MNRGALVIALAGGVFGLAALALPGPAAGGEAITSDKIKPPPTVTKKRPAGDKLRKMPRKVPENAPLESLEEQQRRDYGGGKRSGVVKQTGTKKGVLGAKESAVSVAQDTNEVMGGGADGTIGAKAPGEALSDAELEEEARKQEAAKAEERRRADCLGSGEKPKKPMRMDGCGVFLKESRPHMIRQNIEGLESLVDGCAKATAATAGGCGGKFDPLSRKRCQDYQQFSAGQCGAEKERGYKADLECWRYVEKAVKYRECQRNRDED